MPIGDGLTLIAHAEAGFCVEVTSEGKKWSGVKSNRSDNTSCAFPGDNTTVSRLLSQRKSPVACFHLAKL